MVLLLIGKVLRRLVLVMGVMGWVGGGGGDVLEGVLGDRVEHLLHLLNTRAKSEQNIKTLQ